jgi:hypothetical protein
MASISIKAKRTSTQAVEKAAVPSIKFASVGGTITDLL